MAVKDKALITLNVAALIVTIVWAIAEPSYEPIVGIFLTAAGLIGQGVTRTKRKKLNTDNKISEKSNPKIEKDEQNSKIEKPDKGIEVAKVKTFPESTELFYDRFCSAFPGVRGIKWFTNPDEAIQRLSKLLCNPLVFMSIDGNSAFNPIWWWRYGNMQIEHFERLDNDIILLDRYELKVDKIAAINTDIYYRCFVYLQTKPMEPTGVYDTKPENIESAIQEFGYHWEEYGLFKNKFRVTREEYDDGAAMIEGQLIDFNGEANLRTRYTTPYNLIIAPINSPINNVKFDSELKRLMNGILKGNHTVEDLIQAMEKLPKKEKRG